jgi:geranylgeranyl reductase family protein
MAEMNLMEPYDIVIIGAGPAGSSAAQAAAQRGMKVLLLDKRQRIGVPVQCAEFVPRWISHYISFSSKCILQTTETMVTHLSDQKCYEMKSPGYLLDRSLFDQDLVTSAILYGAQISIQTRAIGLSPEGVIVKQGLKQETIPSKVIIGADGVHSSVARWIGLSPMKTMVALQYEVVIPRPQNHADVFFHPDYEGGYAWLFPRGRTANVGLGILSRRASLLSDRMDHFLNGLVHSKKLSGIDIIGKTGGSIPCQKPRPVVFGNTLLVGDAAGHAHPITGAGILNAVISGEIAGRVASEAIAKGDLHYLNQYEIEWSEVFGKSLSYAAFKRGFLEKSWNKPKIDFENLIRKTWVGFKEYYEDRKGKLWKET